MKRRLVTFLLFAVILAILMLTCDRCRPDQSQPPSEGKLTAIPPLPQSPDTLRPPAQSKPITRVKVETRPLVAEVLSQTPDSGTTAEAKVSVRIDSVAGKTPSDKTHTPPPSPTRDITSLSTASPWYSPQVSVEVSAGHPVIDGLLSSFSLPLNELLVMKTDSELRNLFSGFSIQLAATLPLKKPAKAMLGLKSEGVRSGDLTLSASIRYNPLSYWFVGATFYKYLNLDYKAPWSPEFSYSFGYDDWHPYTLSLVYSNYGGNRLDPNSSKGESFTRFEEGTWSVGWKFVEPYRLEDFLVLFRGGRLTHSINYNLTPQYFDLKSLEYLQWKQSLSLATNYLIYGNWFAGITMFYYLDPGSRQPWNPDYTYSFGYFDWRPEKISIRYANYSGNRFPWNHRSGGTGRFKDGAITISYGWSF